MIEQLTLFDYGSDYLEDEVNNLEDIKSSFRVHASLIYKLGESLITDEITALSELIKNAYDADATMCLLTIDSLYSEVVDGIECKGKIEVYDNGCGMDLNTIINGWLTLSNSPKKKMKKEKRTTPKYHRYPLGDKGLGRLSVQKLGRNMIMVTKAENSSKEYTVEIPWGDFLKNTTIDQIPVKITEKEVREEKAYTKIIIKNLVNNERWNDKEQINVLSNSIGKIVSPFRTGESTFRVIAKINGQEIETTNAIFAELLNSARAKHTIRYSKGKAQIESEYKTTFFYTRKILEQIIGGEFTLSETALRDFLHVNRKTLANVELHFEKGKALKATDECIFDELQIMINESKSSNTVTSDPGDFECEIYEYYLDQGYLDYYYQNISYDRLIDRDEYRGFVERFHGIKVVRDGFMVQGFGEGEGGDWLGLTSSSKTTGNYMDLRNDGVIGCVFLSENKNAVLKETTNREGFVEDEYYYAFKKILSDSLKRINRNRKKLNDAMKAYVINSLASTGNIGENVLSFKPVIEQIREDIKETTPLVERGETHISAAKENYRIAKAEIDRAPFIAPEVTGNFVELSRNIENISEEYSRLLEERNALVKKLDAINLDFEKINERLKDLFELAGLGISVELFAHEFDSSVRSIRIKNQHVVNNQSNQTIDSLIKHINYISFSLDALRKQMSYFNPGLKFVRSEKQVFSISVFLNEHKSFYKERCLNEGILFNINVKQDFDVKMNRGMLNQVFDNLLNNSEYWLEFSLNMGLLVKKEYNIETQEKGIIVVWDNGIGISRDIETRLFEPFESKKRGGRGLGLYIVASNLKYNMARIRVLAERNELGNLFKFEIDLSQLLQ